MKHHRELHTLDLAWGTVLGRWGRDTKGFSKLMDYVIASGQLVNLNLAGNNIGRAYHKKATKSHAKAWGPSPEPVRLLAQVVKHCPGLQKLILGSNALCGGTAYGHGTRDESGAFEVGLCRIRAFKSSKFR